VGTCVLATAMFPLWRLFYSALLSDRTHRVSPVNEISQFQPLLADLDLAGVVVTADAMHIQRDHASFLVDRGADYLLVVKANQPTLHAQLVGLPWRQIPVMDRTRDHGHGRVEVRTLKVATVAGLCFPHAGPGDPGHPPGPPGFQPLLAHRHRVRRHQPNHS
jgi:predicted transposase YbfD/YdcC